VLLVAGGLCLAACGGATGGDADDSTRPREPADATSGEGGVVLEDRFATAATSTIDAGTARVAMTMTMSTPEVGDVSIAVDGALHFGTGDGQMSMAMPLMAEFGDLGDDIAVDARIVDGVMYLRYPERFAHMLGGTPWVSIDLRGAFGEQNQGMLGPFGQADPTQYLEYLAAVSSSVEEVGRESVREVPTTRYHATFDFEKAVDQVPAETLDALGIDADTFDEHLERMRAAVGAEAPVDVWIDDDGLLRRMRMEMDVAGQTAAIDMELYDYGVDVAVEAPPADQVRDMSSMLGELGERYEIEGFAA
jgi:hypothetical protein